MLLSERKEIGLARPRKSGSNANAGADRGIVRTFNRLLVLVVFLTTAYLFMIALESPTMTNWANLLGPLLLGSSAAFAGYRLVTREVLVVWTPYFWFLGAIVLFYCLGPLVYVVGSESLIRYVASSLPIPVYDDDLLRTNLLNSLGVLSILLGLRLGAGFMPISRMTYGKAGFDRRRLKMLAFWLLAIGGALQFLLILPWEFGAFNFVLPGVIYNLAKLFLFGLMVLAYVVAAGEAKWRLLLYLLWALQLIVALIHFSKTEVMITLLLPVLGAYMAHRNIKRLVLAFVAMAIVYGAIAQMIHYGRQGVMELSGGNLAGASISERLAITGRWIEGNDTERELYQPDISSLETGWARLSYVNVQTFAMIQYDQGRPGDTLATAAYVLIPRFIWPEKPYTTDLAKDFYERVVGRRGETYLGLGIFGEGYWNLGWPGVVLLSLVSGLVFWITGAAAIRWMAQQKMEYLPSIFLGIQMGLLGTTQLFANAIVGAGGFILAYALIVSRGLGWILPRHSR